MSAILERIQGDLIGWRRAFVLIAALALINGVTWVAVKENQRNGVYSIDADSIGLPILGTFLISSLVLPVLVSIGLLPSTQWSGRLRARGSAWTVFMGVVLVTLYIIATLFAVGGAGYWAQPDHYVIAFFYLL